MYYLLIGISAIAVLLAVNFLLLKYSCNKADSGKRQVPTTPKKKSALD